MIAVQALAQRTLDLQKENAALRDDAAVLRTRLDRLEAQTAATDVVMNDE